MRGPLGEREAPGGAPSGQSVLRGRCGWRTPGHLCQLQAGVLPPACPLLWPWRSCPSFTWAPVFASGVPVGRGPRASTPVPLGLYGCPHPILLTGPGWVGAGQSHSPDAQGGGGGQGAAEGPLVACCCLLWGPTAPTGASAPPPSAQASMPFLREQLPEVLLEPSTASHSAAWPLLPRAPTRQVSVYPLGTTEAVSAPLLPPPGVSSIF